MAEKWSQHVTETSSALDLEEGVFSWDDPKKNRPLPQKVGPGQHEAEGDPVSIGHVDAEFLHQSGWQGSAGQENSKTKVRKWQRMEPIDWIIIL